MQRGFQMKGGRRLHAAARCDIIPCVVQCQEACTVAPAFAFTKEGDRMKNSDFLAVSGWVFSLLSLLIAVTMLGKGV